MKINLLSPINGATVSLTPKAQAEILSSLPADGTILENDFDWRSPVAGDDDHSAPEHIIFTWGFEGSLAEVTDVVLHLSTTEDFAEADSFDIYAGQMFLSLTNFKEDKYFWKMAAYSGDRVICESATYYFNIDNTSTRWYLIDGATNVRDIGGWKAGGKRIKRNVFFRGSALDKDLTASADALGFLAYDLHIKTDLDLRLHRDEYSVSPIPDANLINVPVFAYADIFDEAEKDKIRDIFSLLADSSSYPVYCHCFAGADRTGTVVALLMALLGASREDICREFELTTLSVFGMRSRCQQHFYDYEKCLEEYGNSPADAARNFLVSCGVTDAQIDGIKQILLEG